MEKRLPRIYGAIAGVTTPFLYVITVFGLGALEPDYNHMTDMMSILGGVEGIRGLLFNISIAILGVQVISFAIGLHHTLNDGRGSKAGPIVLMVGGLGLISSAVFHCDVDCACVIARTTLGIIHMISAMIAGLCIALSMFIFYFRMRSDLLFSAYGHFTLLMAVLGNGAGIMLWISYAAIRITAIEGLLQRLGIVFPLLWIGLIGWQMLRISGNRMTH